MRLSLRTEYFTGWKKCGRIGKLFIVKENSLAVVVIGREKCKSKRSGITSNELLGNMVDKVGSAAKTPMELLIIFMTEQYHRTN